MGLDGAGAQGVVPDRDARVLGAEESERLGLLCSGDGAGVCEGDAKSGAVIGEVGARGLGREPREGDGLSADACGPGPDLDDGPVPPVAIEVRLPCADPTSVADER